MIHYETQLFKNSNQHRQILFRSFPPAFSSYYLILHPLKVDIKVKNSLKARKKTFYWERYLTQLHYHNRYWSQFVLNIHNKIHIITFIEKYNI